MEWDDSCDLNLLGIETTDQCTQTSGISKEQKAILQMHISYHDEMKTFLENFLYKREAEGSLVASVYFKKTYIKSRKSVKFWKCLNTNPIGNKSFKHEKTVSGFS